MVGLRSQVLQGVREYHHVERWVLVVGVGNQGKGGGDIDLVQSRIPAGEWFPTQLRHQAVDGVGMTAMVVAQTLGDVACCGECTGEYAKSQSSFVGIDGVVLERCCRAQQHDVGDLYVGESFRFGHHPDGLHVLAFLDAGLFSAGGEQHTGGTHSAEAQHVTSREPVHEPAPGANDSAPLMSASSSERPARIANAAD